MTPDDEAFVRTIVDRPGDDLPRLVYADWLDERGDERGAYLRAELEWSRWHVNGSISDLEWLSAYTREISPVDLVRVAQRFDPLWISRVTRPPIGVCCDHLGLASAKSCASDMIARLENQSGFVLPIQLTALLLNYSSSDVVVQWELIPRFRATRECRLRHIHGIEQIAMHGVHRLTNSPFVGSDLAWIFADSGADIDIPIVIATGESAGLVTVESHLYELSGDAPRLPIYSTNLKTLGDCLDIFSPRTDIHF